LKRLEKHPWFKCINWQQLEKLEITPPFLPKVVSEDDVSNIDEGFLEQNVNYDSEGEVEDNVPKDAFLGFTFVPQEDS